MVTDIPFFLVDYPTGKLLSLRMCGMNSKEKTGGLASLTLESWTAILVGGLEHDWIIFPYIGNFIIPTDELIFFRGIGIPPTSNAKWRMVD